jgi:hypothetical protein
LAHLEHEGDHIRLRASRFGAQALRAWA